MANRDPEIARKQRRESAARIYALYPERQKERTRRYTEKNRDRILKKAAERREKFKDRGRAQDKAYYERNHDGIIARARARYQDQKAEFTSYLAAWRAKNRAKVAKYARKCRENNPEVYLAIKAKRRALEANALPPWADMAAIREVYAEAARKTAATGVKHHVDHIYPICGRGFVGLHVAWNLRAIPAIENMRKGNQCPR